MNAMIPDSEEVSRLETMHIEPLSATQARLHFSPRAAELLDESTPYGSAYVLSLGSLGIQHEIDTQTITVTGSSSGVIRALPELAVNINALSLESSRKSHEFQHDSYGRLIRQLLRRVIETTSQNVGSTTTFHNTVASLTVPFTDYMLRTGGIRLVAGAPAR